MRDPVERAWSAVNNAAKGAADASSVEVDQARADRELQPLSLCRHDQAPGSRVSRDQVHYCFFEDLRDRQEALTSDLFSYLGVEPVPPTPVQLPQAVNVAARSKPIPPEFSRTMARDYLPMVGICRRFDGPPHRWRARYETLLNGGGS